MYQYIKIQWRANGGDVSTGYQEISNGRVIRNTDLDGNTVDFESFSSCDSWVVDPAPEFPIWGLVPPEPIPEPDPVPPSDPDPLPGG